jgi:prepilin-type N-terminal cleavage/methylation domain-containing protein
MNRWGFFCANDDHLYCRNLSLRYFMKPVSPPFIPIVQRRKTSTGESAQGFTLLESLMAIVVIGITVVSITPPIIWATGTRVQNRRAEQAAQLAQAEVDRVRAVVERRQATLVGLPARVGTTVSPNAPKPTSEIAQATKLRSIVPGCERGDDNPPASATQVILVDTDPEPFGSSNQCQPEYMIQVFRGAGLPQPTASAPDTAPDAFVMGVRVYSIVARNNMLNGSLPTPADNRPRLRATSGLGTQRTQPLAVLYTPIVRSNRSDTLELYRNLCVEARKEGSDAAFCAERK